MVVNVPRKTHAAIFLLLSYIQDMQMDVVKIKKKPPNYRHGDHNSLESPVGKSWSVRKSWHTHWDRWPRARQYQVAIVHTPVHVQPEGEYATPETSVRCYFYRPRPVGYQSG